VIPDKKQTNKQHLPKRTGRVGQSNCKAADAAWPQTVTCPHTAPCTGTNPSRPYCSFWDWTSVGLHRPRPGEGPTARTPPRRTATANRCQCTYARVTPQSEAARCTKFSEQNTDTYDCLSTISFYQMFI